MYLSYPQFGTACLSSNVISMLIVCFKYILSDYMIVVFVFIVNTNLQAIALATIVYK